MDYELSYHLTKLDTPPSNPLSSYIIKVVTSKEWLAIEHNYHLPLDFIHAQKSISICKLETYCNCTLALFNIPTKHHHKEKKHFICIITDTQTLFIDDGHSVIPLLDKLSAFKTFKEPCKETFILSFLEILIQKDLIYIEEMENRLSKLEASILNGSFSHINHKIMEFSKELLCFYYYYSQLIEISTLIEENQEDIFNTNYLKRFSFFTKRVSRLQALTQMLREYTIQIREEYQAQIDIKQNNTMRVLTVVTSIFLPLTLIVGWYGMNFKTMPELDWKYGYLMVIILNLLTLSFCIWLFKKKKFF